MRLGRHVYVVAYASKRRMRGELVRDLLTYSHGDECDLINVRADLVEYLSRPMVVWLNSQNQRHRGSIIRLKLFGSFENYMSSVHLCFHGKWLVLV